MVRYLSDLPPLRAASLAPVHRAGEKVLDKAKGKGRSRLPISSKWADFHPALEGHGVPLASILGSSRMVSLSKQCYGSYSSISDWLVNK